MYLIFLLCIASFWFMQCLLLVIAKQLHSEWTIFEPIQTLNNNVLNPFSATAFRSHWGHLRTYSNCGKSKRKQNPSSKHHLLAYAGLQCSRRLYQLIIFNTKVQKAGPGLLSLYAKRLMHGHLKLLGRSTKQLRHYLNNLQNIRNHERTCSMNDSSI